MRAKNYPGAMTNYSERVLEDEYRIVTPAEIFMLIETIYGARIESDPMGLPDAPQGLGAAHKDAYLASEVARVCEHQDQVLMVLRYPNRRGPSRWERVGPIKLWGSCVQVEDRRLDGSEYFDLLQFCKSKEGVDA